ncbi:hypothetical protein SETIT_5G031500v2 [Setaria italica]|uniref:Uncharacterized protein n=1 Tax=Setaria italica TaxID=4555 RepID=A0A368R0P2_SETIT|nr:hypothetical protein SETIT_5G031500v2 [Setaria italica]
MRNSSRLQQLGLPGFTGVFARTTVISQEKNKTNARDREDSESEYDPLQDDNGEEDLIAYDIAKVLIYFSQHDDNTNMADRADGITLPAGQNQMTNEGGKERQDRGFNMGKVVITEGNIRAVVPLVAAKFATKCNIAVRIHVPVLTHRKEYKKQPAQFNLFMGRLCFNIDTSDEIVKKGCLEMMNKNILILFHYIWLGKVLLSNRLEACQKNKDNQGNVKFHQTTGSCSYPVLVENLGDKYKDQEPDAFDLFKECHYSKKKKVYTPIIQLAILSAPTEGEQPNFATQVVADPRCSVKNVKADLETEKRANAELQSIVNSQRAQVDDLSKKVQETENARIRDQEEIKMKQAEMEAKLEVLLGQS